MVTRRDRIRNTVTVEGLTVKPPEKVVEERKKERQLSWLGQLLRIGEDTTAQEEFEADYTEKTKPNDRE